MNERNDEAMLVRTAKGGVNQFLEMLGGSSGTVNEERKSRLQSIHYTLYP